MTYGQIIAQTIPGGISGFIPAADSHCLSVRARRGISLDGAFQGPEMPEAMDLIAWNFGATTAALIWATVDLIAIRPYGASHAIAAAPRNGWRCCNNGRRLNLNVRHLRCGSTQRKRSQTSVRTAASVGEAVPSHGPRKDVRKYAACMAFAVDDLIWPAASIVSLVIATPRGNPALGLIDGLSVRADERFG